MATGDDVYIPKLSADRDGKISVQDLNAVIRLIFNRFNALEGRTEESTVRNNLTVMGMLTATSLSAEPFQRVYDKTVLTPDILSANQNAYNPGSTYYFWRLQASAPVEIRGILSTDAIDGQQMILTNIGTNTITLMHKSSFAAVPNRFDCPLTADVILDTSQSALVWRDDASSVWRVAAF